MSPSALPLSALPAGTAAVWEPDAVLNPRGWDIFFSAICSEKGIQRELPIGDLLFPATGGETAAYPIVDR